jgi:hypothetical protein
MSWLLEIVESAFGALYDSARRGTWRDESRPMWLRGSLVVSYYVLPTLCLVSIFLSWRLAVVIAALFVASLTIGAMTEADDPRFH